jgi:hypothetical protein
MGKKDDDDMIVHCNVERILNTNFPLTMAYIVLNLVTGAALEL